MNAHKPRSPETDKKTPQKREEEGTVPFDEKKASSFFSFLIGFFRMNFSFICHPNLALFGSNERGERALSGGTFCSGCRSLPRLSKIFLSIGPFLTSPATVDPIFEESLLFPCLFFFGRHVRRPQKNFWPLRTAVPSLKLDPSLKLNPLTDWLVKFIKDIGLLKF